MGSAVQAFPAPHTSALEPGASWPALVGSVQRLPRCLRVLGCEAGSGLSKFSKRVFPRDPREMDLIGEGGTEKESRYQCLTSMLKEASSFLSCTRELQFISKTLRFVFVLRHQEQDSWAEGGCKGLGVAALCPLHGLCGLQTLQLALAVAIWAPPQPLLQDPEPQLWVSGLLLPSLGAGKPLDRWSVCAGALSETQGPAETRSLRKGFVGEPTLVGTGWPSCSRSAWLLPVRVQSN